MAAYAVPGRSAPARRRRHTYHRRRIRRGAVLSPFAWVLILAAAGFCAVLAIAGHTVIQSVRGGGAASVPAESAAFFESYLAPVVMQDPKPFRDIRTADGNTLMQAAIWSALDGDGKDSLSMTAENRELLPVSKIETAFEKLFGTAVKPDYRTFTQGGATYTFDAASGCYAIPMIALDNVFSPRVVTRVRQGDTVTLTVDYIPGTGWMQKADGSVSSPAARKRMIYVLSGRNGSYRIVSLSQAALPPAAVSSAGSKAASSASSGGASQTASAQSKDVSRAASSVPGVASMAVSSAVSKGAAAASHVGGSSAVPAASKAGAAGSPVASSKTAKH